MSTAILALPILSTLQLTVLCGLLALALALLVGVYARPLARRLSLLDFPDSDGGRKRHSRVTPLVGGIAVAMAAVGSALLVRWLDSTAAPALSLHLGWLAATVAAMFMIGVADDRFHLSPRLRLIAAVLMLLLVVSYAPDFSLAFLRFAGQDKLLLLGRSGDAFTLLCLVGLLNAVNMADGKNGLVLGMGLIWTAVLAVHAPATMTPVLAGTGVALAVMWGFNMTGKLFLGDGGSYAISGFVGLLAIYAYNHDFDVMRADDVAVMFAIPVFDTMRLMAVRAFGGRSPFEGDRDHLHHHLHARLGWPRGLWAYLALVGIPNLGAVLWQGTGLLWLAVSLGAYVLAMLKTRYPAMGTRGAPAE